MGRVVDLRGDAAAWDALVAEVLHLATHLPDGQQRVTRFYACMDLFADTEDYVRLEPAAEDGVAVMRLVPGPKAEAFLAELRKAAGVR